MGYDAYVHIIKKYSKSSIENLLRMMDYEKKGQYFYCGNDDEYKLFTGVSIWLSDEDNEEWIYRIGSQIFAVGYDLKKMNDTIRGLKQYCDATFESDEGKNRYFKEDILIKGVQSGCLCF